MPFRLRYLVVPLVFLGLVTAILWVVPTGQLGSTDAYYIFAPDRAKPLAAHVQVAGADPQGGGDVYYVDAFVRKASLLERILPFTRPDGSTLVPAERYLPPGISDRERQRQVAAEMERSTRIAPVVALRALGRDVRATPTGILVIGVIGGAPAAGRLQEGDVIVEVDGKRVRTPAELRAAIGRRRPGERVRLTLRRDEHVQRIALRTIADPDQATRPIVGIQVDQAARISLPVKIKIDLGRVGGPSAGLPFALEIARMLGRNVTHGCRVAATGELALDGSVLPVGAVKQKTIGAREAHVDAFLVPVDGDNAKVAKRYAHGLRIVPVKSFQQALQSLATLRRKA
jgi:PDZ domain-containing protein